MAILNLQFSTDCVTRVRDRETGAAGKTPDGLFLHPKERIQELLELTGNRSKLYLPALAFNVKP